MREILFRGQAANRIDGRAYRTNYKNGDWVYGLLTDAENYAGFSEMTNTIGVSGIEVDKNTVGQYTGMTDKKGTKIFEGDIIKVDDAVKETFPQVEDGDVRFSRGGFFVGSYGDILRSFDVIADYKGVMRGEVIGNIHDNPDLLESGHV